ncbi:MAG: hypothetical protein MUC92_09330 [Fimbriimonadaceae bacterium]|jgi:hypothetical protein|nr:hypothetical protein [Fimbriimonadaceae bacterium]
MNDFYRKLVDQYAGSELPEELEQEMEGAAMADPELAGDMFTLRKTVELLQGLPAPEFTNESFYRILMRMHAAGVNVETQTPEPTHYQYQLPMQG